MDVHLCYDSRGQPLPLRVDKEFVQVTFPQFEKLEAYRVLPCTAYTLYFSIPQDAFYANQRSTWSIKMIRGVSDQVCKREKEHHSKFGAPTLFLCNQPRSALRAFDFDRELLLRGTDSPVTIRFLHCNAVGCNICDVFFLQINYVGYWESENRRCRSTFQQETIIPFILLTDEL